MSGLGSMVWGSGFDHRVWSGVVSDLPRLLSRCCFCGAFARLCRGADIEGSAKFAIVFPYPEGPHILLLWNWAPKDNIYYGVVDLIQN